MAFFLQDRAARKSLRQQVKLFTFQNQCHLCGFSIIGYIQHTCIGCGKFIYCSPDCLEKDMRDHLKYCKLNYPKMEPVTRDPWHHLELRRLNARNAQRTPPPQDNSEDRPRTLKSVPFIFIQSTPSYRPRFERSDSGSPLITDWIYLPRLIPTQEPEPEDPFKPKSYLTE